jgi:hypothetical protein
LSALAITASGQQRLRKFATGRYDATLSLRSLGDPRQFEA